MTDPKKLSDIVDTVKQGLHEKLRKLLLAQPMSDGEIADALTCTPALARTLVAELRQRKVRVNAVAGNRFYIDQFTQPGGHVVIINKTGRLPLGFTTDNHICNRHFRKDVAEAAYDDFVRRGVTTALNAGNMMEGEARFNKQELKAWGMMNQCEMVANEFPLRPGITTYFITGDDHEGWYAQRERIVIGEYMQEQFRKKGRKDLRYVGHVEADIEFKVGDKSCTGKIMHPGGGSAYAISYTSQKIVEAFQGGEKPAIVFGGHYHKYDHCYPREVHYVQGGCTCDQTMFMRKNKIAAHVGYVNIEIEQDSYDGHLSGMSVGWRPFYDRGYYEARFE